MLHLLADASPIITDDLFARMLDKLPVVGSILGAIIWYNIKVVKPAADQRIVEARSQETTAGLLSKACDSARAATESAERMSSDLKAISEYILANKENPNV